MTTKLSHLAPVAAMVLFAALVVPFLGARSVWTDEGTSLAFAALSPLALWHAIHHTDATMGAYYLLLHCWEVFGRSDAATRVLSVIAAMGAVGLGSLAARRLFDDTVAVVAAFLLAVVPILGFEGSDLRPYALVTCASAGAAYFLVRSAQRPSAGNLTGYAALAATALYFHALAAFVLIAHLLSLPVLGVERKDVRRWVVAYLAIGILALPVGWALVIGRQAGQLAWLAPPRPHDVWALLVGFFSGSTILAVAFLLLAAAAVVIARPRRSALALAIWFAVPLVLDYVVSRTVQPVFLPRYLIEAIVPLAILAAAAVARLRSPALIAVATAALVLWGVRVDRSVMRMSYEDFRGAVGSLAANKTNGAVVVTYPAVTVYADKQELPKGSFLHVVYPGRGWQYWAPNATTVAQSVGSARRVDVILRDYDAPDLDAWRKEMLANYRTVSTRAFHGLDVATLERE